METTAKQYEITINNASKISQVLLDMEGGRYALAMFSELVQGLLEEGNISGAASVVRKLHGAAEVPFEQIASNETNTATWLSLFSEALDNTLEEGIF